MNRVQRNALKFAHTTKVGNAMARFIVNFIPPLVDKVGKPTVSQYGTYRILLQALESVAMNVPAGTQTALCAWLPEAKYSEYLALFTQAKSENKKFVLEADVSEIKPGRPWTNTTTQVTSQDFVVRFSGTVSKSIELDSAPPVNW